MVGDRESRPAKFVKLLHTVMFKTKWETS